MTVAATAPIAGPLVGTTGLTLTRVKPDGGFSRPLKRSRDIGVFANVIDARVDDVTPGGSGAPPGVVLVVNV
jgi:hypothetical protein